jgi:hypothetical protein
MRTLTFFLIALLCTASAASADIIYRVTVNTSTISGTSGSFDLQFNQGPLASQAAQLQILNFAIDGTLAGGPLLTGDVSGGPLPAILNFDNGAGFNDYFEGITFGSILSFDVRLYGPAVNFPDGTSTSGSTFAFSMFSDAGGTVPVLTADLIDGFAAMVDINLDGTTTVTNFSSQTSIGQANAVPEPSSFVLFGTAMALMGAWGRSRGRSRG